MILRDPLSFDAANLAAIYFSSASVSGWRLRRGTDKEHVVTLDTAIALRTIVLPSIQRVRRVICLHVWLLVSISPNCGLYQSSQT